MKTLIYTLILFISGSLPAQTVLTFNFPMDQEGWTGDFADYPVGEEVFYELEFQWSPLPPPLNSSENALKIQGNNHSDDLFMFIKRKIEGLVPNTGYQVFFKIMVASDAPTNAIGIGGPPGEAVIMKAGATQIEPMKMNDGQGFYVMNIDKGNQSQPGPDMDTIGHVGVADNTTAFTLISRDNTTHPFFVTANAEGEAWLIIGTDSGFEGLSTLYYDHIEVTFTNLVSTNQPTEDWEGIIYPNPTKSGFAIKAPEVFRRVDIVDAAGKLIRTYQTNTAEFFMDEPLSMGVYFVQVLSGQHIFQRKIIVY